MTNSEQGLQKANSTTYTSRLPRLVEQVNNSRSGVQMFDISTTDFVTLVAKCTTLIGCQLPSAEAVMVLCNFMKDTYPLLFDNEIYLAVQLNAAGKLKSRTEHYNSFDASYLGMILNNFTEYKREAALLEAKQRKEPETTALPQATSSGTFEEIISKDLETLKRGGNMLAALYLAPKIVDYLTEAGRLENVTDELVRAWDAAARKTISDTDATGKWRPNALARYKRDNRAEYREYLALCVIEKKRECYMWYLKNQIK